jgi:hypothetical protein
VLRFCRDFCATLPDEAEAYCALLTDPQAGVPVIALLLGYDDPLDEEERVLRPAREFGPPLADLVAPVPYVARVAARNSWWDRRGPGPFPRGRIALHEAHEAHVKRLAEVTNR